MGIKNYDGKSSLSVREMLDKGVTPAEMRKQLEDEIQAAQEEMKKEREREESALNEAREDLIDAAILYLDALGVIDADDISDEDYEKLTRFTKTYEKNIKDIDSFTKSDDAIIRAFLRTF